MYIATTLHVPACIEQVGKGRIGAALAMKVEDVYVQNRRLWVRLNEKGSKRPRCPATPTSRLTCTPTRGSRCTK